MTTVEVGDEVVAQLYEAGVADSMDEAVELAAAWVADANNTQEILATEADGL